MAACHCRDCAGIGLFRHPVGTGWSAQSNCAAAHRNADQHRGPHDHAHIYAWASHQYTCTTAGHQYARPPTATDQHPGAAAHQHPGAWSTDKYASTCRNGDTHTRAANGDQYTSTVAYALAHPDARANSHACIHDVVGDERTHGCSTWSDG